MPPQTQSQPNQQPTALDPDIVNLAKATRDVESNNNPTVRGKSGEYGLYQYEPATWSAQSKAAGVNVPLEQATPAQQNEVWYKWAKSKKDAGFNVGQIASMQNAGEGKPNAYTEGNKGTNAEGVAYDTADYAKKVATAYQKYKSQRQPSASDTGVDTAQASTGTQQPESTLNKALDVGKSVGDFLFPAVGDVYHDIKGDSKKTALQQAGDAALTALPFIPGLGEVGEAARGTEAGVEGASLFGKVAASPIARNVVTGYGAGVAQNLSQGKGIGESIAPNINTVGGGILGLGGGLASKALTGVLDRATGIAENTKPVLSKLSDPKLYDEYTNVATKRAQDINNPSVLEHAADYTEKAVGKMKQNITDVGKQVGDLKNTEGAKPLASVVPVLQKFKQELEDKFGLTISTNKVGTGIRVEKMPGRMKDVLSTKDTSRIKDALSQLLKLNKNGNVRKASDVIDNLDGLVDYSKKDLLGNSNDPLEGFLKSTRHNLNDVVGKSSSTLADAKTRFHELSDALESVKSAGGSNLQRAELLLKRVFSGDQSQTSRDIFKTIQKETGVNLTEHAVLAKHFVDNMGDESSKTLLQKMLEGSSMKGGTTVPDLLLSGGKHALNATVANPIREGKRIVEGRRGLIRSALDKGVPTKGLLTGARGLLGNQ